MRSFPSFPWRICIGVFGLCLFYTCQTPQDPEQFQAPLFNNLGEHQLEISTSSPHAQRFFNQGLNLSYGFNHAEAARAFREAVRLDSTCAMCNWGAAYVLGPNYNAGMEDDARQEAQHYARQALQHMSEAQGWEQALIRALQERYAYEQHAAQEQLNQNYAEAMRRAHREFAGHDEIQVLLAESLMNLHPWDLYEKNGTPRAWTPEITTILEEVLERNPNHPGANHLYIHAVEASSQPEQGLPSADRLGELVPGSGHLVHMPSHIYIRTGRYHEGSVANQKAIAVDSQYIASCRAQGVYPMLYFPHNVHFLTATASLEGRSRDAADAAFQVASLVDTSFLRMPGMEALQHFMMTPHLVLVKFNQWDRLLEMPQPDDDLLYANALWYFSRGMALAGKGQLQEAEQVLQQLKTLAEDTALAGISIWNINTADKLTHIAVQVLSADIQERKGNYNGAVAAYREAIALEDQLNYNEPPDWLFSVRHALGAALLAAGQYPEAEQVYREDLVFVPENGWALQGLQLSLQHQNKMKEARDVAERFSRAWQYADTPLKSSVVDPEAVPVYTIKQVSSPVSLPDITICGVRKS